MRRSKTKNFLSIHSSASRRRGGGRRREKNARKFFGSCTRESASVSEAHWLASPRNRSVRCSFKPPRAPRVRFSHRQDFGQSTFELCLIHTAVVMSSLVSYDFARQGLAGLPNGGFDFARVHFNEQSDYKMPPLSNFPCDPF